MLADSAATTSIGWVPPGMNAGWGAESVSHAAPLGAAEAATAGPALHSPACDRLPPASPKSTTAPSDATTR